MSSRWLLFLSIMFAPAVLLVGCLGSRDTSYGSAWTGLAAVAPEAETATPTATLATPTIVVQPTATVLGQQQSTPVSVTVSAASGTIDDVDIIMASSLEGTFAPATGKVSNGFFTTMFTSGMANGACTITATCQGASGAAVIQINGRTLITITPARASIKQGESQVISVLVTDERGTRLNDVDVYIDSSAGGEFTDNSVKTVNGLAYFTYKAPAVMVNTPDTIKALALGTSGTTVLTVTP